MVLKPSETSKAIEKILAEILPRYLDQVIRVSPGLGLDSSSWGKVGDTAQSQEGLQGMGVYLRVCVLVCVYVCSCMFLCKWRPEFNLCVS